MISIIQSKLALVSIFISFAVKMPMFPVHTWLPDAHVDSGRVCNLSRCFTKNGWLWYIEIFYPTISNWIIVFTDLVFVLSVIAIIYTSLSQLRRKYKLIAYSSVAHGFCDNGNIIH